MKVKLYKFLFCKCLNEKSNVILCNILSTLKAVSSKIKFHINLTLLLQRTLAFPNN